MHQSEFSLRASSKVRHPPNLHVAFGDEQGATTDAQALETASECPPKWSVEEIVQLHFFLLDDLGRLADASTPLEERFELIEWVFTDPEKDDAPFSFKNCVRLYKGTCDADEVRSEMQRLAWQWFDESLGKLPEWLSTQIRRDPQWAAIHLHRNPQWINEQLLSLRREPDLFAGCAH